LVALGAWLVWQRRWRALALFVGGVGTPVFLWWMRAQRFGAPVYVNELWMVDPYDPSLGRLSVLGLVARFGNNLLGYVTRHVPGGIVGTQASWVAGLGLVLIVLAAVGWARAMQRAPGLAEIFVPLYVGLILLWPEVWSGDRFALPLYPLLFFYAGDALLSGAARLGRGAVFLTAVVAVLAVGGPAAGAWTRSLSSVRRCAAFVRASGPFGCYGPAVEEFVSIALWSRTALPEGA
jgi:hypothetical protein